MTTLNEVKSALNKLALIGSIAPKRTELTHTNDENLRLIIDSCSIDADGNTYVTEGIFAGYKFAERTISDERIPDGVETVKVSANASKIASVIRTIPNHLNISENEMLEALIELKDAITLLK